jgi:hypothetical protein
MHSLLQYAASAEFNPAATLDPALVVKLLGAGNYSAPRMPAF